MDGTNGRKVMIIYKIENKINGKIYIGRTINKLEARVRQHLNRKNGSLINLAFNKYGCNSFDVSVIDYADTESVLDEKEIYWIKYFNSISPNGYNLKGGGEGGGEVSQVTRRRMSVAGKNKPPCSLETRKRLSIATKNNPPNRKGGSMSEEAKRKISAANKGKTVSKATRSKISNKLMGHVQSMETRNKISESLKGARRCKSSQ